ncbi:MAG: hypothetical protein ABL993_02460 [Vicinamibacterales bacterium]
MGETTRAVETMLRRLLTACEGTNIVDPRVIAEGHDVLRALLAAPTSLPADAGRGGRAEVERLREALKPFAGYACSPVGCCTDDDGAECYNCTAARALLSSEPRGQEAGKVREEHMGTLHVDHNMSPVTLNGALAGVTLIPVVGHRDCYNVILRTFVEPVGGIPQGGGER